MAVDTELNCSIVCLVRYLDPEFAIGGTSYHPIVSCFLPLISFFPLVLFLLCSPWDFLFLQKNAFCKSDWLPQRLLLTQYQLTQTTCVSGSGVRCPHFPHRAFYLPILNQNLDPHPFFWYVAWWALDFNSEPLSTSCEEQT